MVVYFKARDIFFIIKPNKNLKKCKPKGISFVKVFKEFINTKRLPFHVSAIQFSGSIFISYDAENTLNYYLIGFLFRIIALICCYDP